VDLIWAGDPSLLGMTITQESRAMLFDEMADEHEKVIWLNEVAISRTSDADWKSLLVAENISLRLQVAQERHLAGLAREGVL
jgi:hypothetical protein